MHVRFEIMRHDEPIIRVVFDETLANVIKTLPRALLTTTQPLSTN